MGKLIRTRRSEIRKAVALRLKKPGWCSLDDWNYVCDPLNARADQFEQQREARRVQMETQGTSRLGSGGRARLRAFMVIMLLQT